MMIKIINYGDFEYKLKDIGGRELRNYSKYK